MAFDITRWIPDRKVVAGGVAAVTAFFVMMGLNTWAGLDIGYETASAAVGGVFLLVSYLVPQSFNDWLRRADKFLLELVEDDEPDETEGGVATETAPTSGGNV